MDLAPALQNDVEQWLFSRFYLAAVTIDEDTAVRKFCFGISFVLDVVRLLGFRGDYERSGNPAAGLDIPWAIATSSWLDSARPTLRLLGVGSEAVVISRNEVVHAKPNPGLVLAAAARLGVEITDSIVVGDNVWDLLAARAIGVGLLAGGYGRDELERAGAYRIYEDPADLLRHLDEMGVRTTE